MYAMINIKGLPVEFGDEQTLLDGTKKKSFVFGQDRAATRMEIVFWNSSGIAVCNSIELKKPTYITNVQIKQWRVIFRLELVLCN